MDLVIMRNKNPRLRFLRIPGAMAFGLLFMVTQGCEEKSEEIRRLGGRDVRVFAESASQRGVEFILNTVTPKNNSTFMFSFGWCFIVFDRTYGHELAQVQFLAAGACIIN